MLRTQQVTYEDGSGASQEIWIRQGDDPDIPDDATNVRHGGFGTDSLSVPNLEVLLGAIYALERIAQDSERDHIPIMETLCAYIRENSFARARGPRPRRLGAAARRQRGRPRGASGTAAGAVWLLQLRIQGIALGSGPRRPAHRPPGGADGDRPPAGGAHRPRTPPAERGNWGRHGQRGWLPSRSARRQPATRRPDRPRPRPRAAGRNPARRGEPAIRRPQGLDMCAHVPEVGGFYRFQRI